MKKNQRKIIFHFLASSIIILAVLLLIIYFNAQHSEDPDPNHFAGLWLLTLLILMPLLKLFFHFFKKAWEQYIDAYRIALYVCYVLCLCWTVILPKIGVSLPGFFPSYKMDTDLIECLLAAFIGIDSAISIYLSLETEEKKSKD